MCDLIMTKVPIELDQVDEPFARRTILDFIQYDKSNQSF